MYNGQLDYNASSSGVVLSQNTAIGGAGGALYWEQRKSLFIGCPVGGYNEQLNASLVYYDYPTAQYAPCASWVGNTATEGAVGNVMATTPIMFNLVYEPPPRAALPSEESMSAYATESPTVEGGSVTNVSSAAVVVPEYASGSGIVLGVLLYDMYGQLLNQSVTNNASITDISALDAETAGQNSVTVGGLAFMGRLPICASAFRHSNLHLFPPAGLNSSQQHPGTRPTREASTALPTKQHLGTTPFDSTLTCPMLSGRSQLSR